MEHRGDVRARKAGGRPHPGKPHRPRTRSSGQKLVVDATIISAPSSTRNQSGTRDQEMRRTNKGTQWYFGMKVHVGSDAQGLVHSLVTTDAAQADINQLPDLIHGEEEAIYGDAAYRSEPDRRSFQEVKMRFRMNGRTRRCRSGRSGSTGSIPGCVREWSIPFTWSSGSGASRRSGTGAWRRIRLARTRPSPWRISIWRGNDWPRRGRSVSGSAECRAPEPENRVGRPRRGPRPEPTGRSRARTSDQSPPVQRFLNEFFDSRHRPILIHRKASRLTLAYYTTQ